VQRTPDEITAFPDRVCFGKATSKDVLIFSGPFQDAVFQNKACSTEVRKVGDDAASGRKSKFAFVEGMGG
jgi:hypothetical protein